MATITNSEVIQEIRDSAKIQAGMESIPNQLENKVIPVMEVNPKLLRRINIVKTATANAATSATIYTTPTDQDFYLVSLTLSMIKDSSATSVESSITAIIDGATIKVASIVGITLTAQNDSISLTFPFPMKIDKNTSIYVTNSTNTAVIKSLACIHGYLVNNPYA